MTARKKILQLVYPLFMWFSGIIHSKDLVSVNKNSRKPAVSMYDLKGELNNGKIFSLSDVKGKKILIVNTASDCGYTNQYEELQELFSLKKDKLIILGFPANDFKDQETADDETIATFCKVNYGVSFPLFKKSVILKEKGQHEIFSWLCDATKNGWNNEPPFWNFTKYLINEEGILTHIFHPSVSPLNKDILNAIG